MPENQGDILTPRTREKTLQDASEGEKQHVYRLSERAYPPDYRKRWEFW